MKARVVNLVCLFLIFSTVSWAGGYSGGTGDPNEPYLIADANDWVELTGTPVDWADCFELAGNIDLSGVSSLSPVGTDANSFTGVFDGNDFVISNVTINSEEDDYVGLFGYLGSGGEILNLGVADVNIVGDSYVGGLVACSFSGTISNCDATGVVSGEGFAGGLVGHAVISTINNCYAKGLVEGGGYAGGLAGFIYSGCTVNNCYATSDVESSYCSGGLVGFVLNSSINKCYAAGWVEGTGSAGGLVGLINISSITNCFWDTDTSGLTVGVGNYPNSTLAVGLTTSQMQTESNFTDAGWDFVRESDNGTDDIWFMDGYPRLSREFDETVYSFVWYVDADVTASGDGRTWDTAFKYLDEALDVADTEAFADDEIWVAEGTYCPDESDPEVSFELVDNVGLYGGFDGTETARSQRDWDSNTTIISGRPASTIISENLVIGAEGAVMDGFVLQYATGGIRGGGFKQGVTTGEVPTRISNCIFRYLNVEHDGGAVSFTGGGSTTGSSTIIIQDCEFYSNYAAVTGGAMYVNGVCLRLELTNCLFRNNYTTDETDDGTWEYGGAIYLAWGYGHKIKNCVFDSNRCAGKYAWRTGGAMRIGLYGTVDHTDDPVEITNCVFKGNHAYLGGALYLTCSDYHRVDIANCTFYGNYTYCSSTVYDPAGAAIYVTGSGTGSNHLLDVRNSILWDILDQPSSGIRGTDEIANNCGVLNVYVSYCCRRSSSTADPCFHNESSVKGPDGLWMTADDGLSLAFDSPYIDMGHGDYAPETDILGSTRYDDPNTVNTGAGTPDYVDLGAYEFQG